MRGGGAKKNTQKSTHKLLRGVRDEDAIRVELDHPVAACQKVVPKHLGALEDRDGRALPAPRAGAAAGGHVDDEAPHLGAWKT